MPKIANRQQYLLGGTIVVLAAIGLYGLVPRLNEFSSSMDILRAADLGWVAAAVVAGLLSAVCGAVIYTQLSLKRLRFLNTLLVQLSGLFINRVLPAGVGGLGLNYLYLRARRHTLAQATTIVALNNALGFVGHMLLAIIMLLAAPAAFSAVRLPEHWLPIAVLIAMIGVVLSLSVWRWRRSLLRPLVLMGRHYAKRPRRLLTALLASMALTGCHVTSLWLSCQALELSLSFLAVFVVFTFGIAVQTATPTPGGLGGAEAALVAGLVLQHVPAASALAAVLLYRLVTYWLGLIVGALALVAVKRRHLLHAS